MPFFLYDDLSELPTTSLGWEEHDSGVPIVELLWPRMTWIQYAHMWQGWLC